MKRVYIVTALTCAVILAVLATLLKFMNLSGGKDELKVGFIYDNDESTPYTYNFSLAKDALEKKYGSKVEIFTCSNVLDDEMEKPLRDKGIAQHLREGALGAGVDKFITFFLLGTRRVGIGHANIPERVFRENDAERRPDSCL